MSGILTELTPPLASAALGFFLPLEHFFLRGHLSLQKPGQAGHGAQPTCSPSGPQDEAVTGCKTSLPSQFPEIAYYAQPDTFLSVPKCVPSF